MNANSGEPSQALYSAHEKDTRLKLIKIHQLVVFCPVDEIDSNVHNCGIF